MSVYYNEIDPFAAAWLRELIKAGHIADGEVDERSIEDVLPNELTGFTQCHFFAGIGVWSYALRRAGWSDDTPLWTGSCPCQPFSTAGKGAGFNDERHLWPSFHYLIEQCQPPVVFGEQVAGQDGATWLDLVSADLEATNYAVGSTVLTAAGIGAPHKRERLYWVADTNNARLPGQRKPQHINVSQGWQTTERYTAPRPLASHVRDWPRHKGADGKFRAYPFEYGTPTNVTTNRVGRLRGYGNAINAEAAQIFIESYMEARQVG